MKVLNWLLLGCACVGVAWSAGADTKVLAIGNSFSDSLLTDFPGVAKSVGVNLDFTSLYIGGCSLKRHVSNLRRDGEKDFAPYQMVRYVRGEKTADTYVNVGTVLKGSEKYDIITVQQASPASWRPETYADGDELLAAIHAYQPHAKVYVQETWSYTPWDGRLKDWHIDPDRMFAGIHAACAKFAARHGLSVIPMGSAVQKWRQALPVVYTENSFGGDLTGGRWRAPDKQFEKDEKGVWRPAKKCDVYHLNERGEYFQALLWTAFLFDVDVRTCTYNAKKTVTPEQAEKMRNFVMSILKKPRFDIVMTAGAPRLAIDGVPVAGTAAMPSPNVLPGQSVDSLKSFDAAGVRFYSDVWTMKDSRYNSRHWWMDEGQYDWAIFDRMARGLLDASPDGYIFPRIKIDPPAKWLDAHPEEKYPFVVDKPDSREVKPDSLAWRRLYRGMLKDMLDHVAKTDYADRVMGYHLGAFHCGEWLIWPLTADFLPPSPVIDKRDPLPPAELTAARQATLGRLTDDIATAALDAGRTLRELTGGTKLVGGFFGYYSGSHEKMGRVIGSSAFDFFAAPPHYSSARAPGHPGCSQAYHQASFRLHGKIFYEESDHRTFLSDPRQRKVWGVQLLERDAAVGVIRRSIGKCLAGGGENWWFLLGGNKTYSDPKMMESIRIGAETEKATLTSAEWRPAEVAVFTSADEFATGYAANSEQFREQCKDALHRDILPVCGVPYDAYELSDIADPDLPDYKVYVFPNAFTLSDELREKIKARVRRPGKTAVWIVAPGYYRNGVGNVTNVSDLVGQPIRETYPVADGPYSRRFAAEGNGIVACDGGRSVFLSLPPDAATLRETFRAAGAHVWLETPDVLAVGRGFVMIHAAKDGLKRLRLPVQSDTTEIFGAAPPQKGVGEIVETLKRGETRVYLNSPGKPIFSDRMHTILTSREASRAY